MSEVKINEELQDDPAVEETDVDQNVEENDSVSDADLQAEETSVDPEAALAAAKEQIVDLQDRMLRAAADLLLQTGDQPFLPLRFCHGSA